LAEKEARQAMAVILRDVPPGHHWGWFSREDPRMHLQTVDEEHRNLYKVWLERKGTRVFEPADQIPARILKKLEAEVVKRRRHIEGRWAIFMIKHRWLQLHVSLPEATITAYPGTPNKFIRKIDLQQYFSTDAYATIKPQDIGLNMELGALTVFKHAPEDLRHDFDLAEIIWQG
jgi:hypothetical protein